MAERGEWSTALTVVTDVEFSTKKSASSHHVRAKLAEWTRTTPGPATSHLAQNSTAVSWANADAKIMIIMPTYSSGSQVNNPSWPRPAHVAWASRALHLLFAFILDATGAASLTTMIFILNKLSISSLSFTPGGFHIAATNKQTASVKICVPWRSGSKHCVSDVVSPQINRLASEILNISTGCILAHSILTPLGECLCAKATACGALASDRWACQHVCVPACVCTVKQWSS